MKKVIRNIILIFIIMLLPNLNVKAYEYEITEFDVEMVVNEDNSFDIKEKINAYFNIPKHGIYRTIPLRNTVIREDESSYKNRAIIKDVDVDNEYETSREDGNYVIKIGSASRTLTGNQSYTIKYKYNIGNDKEKEFDELYYNLIGTGWDTTIEGVTFKITMPKEFDESKLGFSAGSYGTIGTSDIEYEVNGNVITGKYNNTIYPGSGLTVRLELPEGYFIKQKTNIMEYVVYYLVPIVFLGLTILAWYKYGKDDIPVETVEFYPPEGKNSLEVGFLYNGKALNQDVTSLLIYLANKGYIKIVEENTKSKNFKIVKVKDYDSDKEEERLFLSGLFANSSKSETGEEFVTKDDLYNSFYITMNKILRSINSKENKNLIYEKMPSFSFIFIIFYIATLLLAIMPPLYKLGYDLLMMESVFPLIFLGFGITYLGIIITETSMKKSSKIGASLASIFLLGPGLVFLMEPLMEMPEFIPSSLISILCAFGIIVFYRLLSKRNQYGIEVLGKLKGFKTFLETAEKDKLEAMVLENPTYFYDILPFTYVLGVSDKWIKKFESISMQAPDWYYGPTAFDVIRFNNFIDNTMTVAARTMTSSPSSSSGGGFSGGGFSGGGSGGGGGGSW